MVLSYLKPNILPNILGTIGKTPLIELTRVTRGIRAKVFAKVETFNPGGSVKDRIGVAMIEDAERRGLLRPGGTIVEATSGNTGVGLAIAAAVKGYKIVFTIPDKMSQEKIDLLKAFGARVIVCPMAVPPDHPESYYSVAKRLARENPNTFLADQYNNPKNPEAHYLTTGPEIWDQTDGEVDYVVAGMGTGGTISGVGRFLKEKKSRVKIIGVDPVGSVLKEYFDTGVYMPENAHTYKVEGIGEDIIPKVLHFQYIDEIIKVGDKEAFRMARQLAREEGILCGGSSGAALYAALKVAKELDESKLVVVLLPDTGERYLSKIYSDEWMRENQFMEYSNAESFLEMKPGELPSLVVVNPEQSVKETISLMAKYGIDQIPVIKIGVPIGTAKEAPLLKALIANPEIASRRVSEYMDEALPVIDSAADIDHVLACLTENSAVLVSKEKQIIGILTRIDLIDFLSDRGGMFV